MKVRRLAAFGGSTSAGSSGRSSRWFGQVLLFKVGDAYWKDPAHPAEDNWVWSPQGEIQMHLPERYYSSFSMFN